MDEETQVQAEPEVEAEYNADVSLPEPDDLFTPSPDEEASAESEPVEETAAEDTEAEPGQEAATEDPGEQATPEVPDQLRQAMETLQRRDVELRQREQAMKQQMAAARELEELKAAIKSDPLEAITRAGGDPTSAMEALIGPDPQQQQLAESPVVKKLMTEIDSLKQNLTSQQQAQQRERQQQHQAALYNEYSQAAAAADPEDLPLLNVFADGYAPTTMFEQAVAHAQQHNAVPTVQQVARQTEELLDKQAMDLIGRLSRVPKYSKFFVQANGDGQKEAASTRQAPPPGKTLRNRDTAEPPPAAKDIDWSKATDSEIIENVSKRVPSLFDE